MADRSKFEEMLERLINEDREGAEELFHEIVVEKSRDIYESLLEDEEVEEDEEVDEAADEEVDESDEDLDEAADEDDDDEDEDMDESFDLDEFEVEADPMDMGGDATDDMMGDLEAGMDDEEGDEMGDDDIEDRVMDLEDALDDLKAEFEKMMGGDDEEEGEDDDEGEEEPEEESYAFESEDEDDDDEEVEEAAEEEVEETRKPKNANEQMREYVEKVTATMGDNGANTKSTVAGPNNMGGTAANIARGDTEAGVEANKGALKGSALNDTSPKDMSTGNVNVPGGKASKSMKNQPAGHGAEKKGKPETADKAATSTLNKVSTRAK